jgi:hypothetical protein
MARTNTHLLKQVGEYLVASELARSGLVVATFSGNVPDFDIIASDQNGRSVPIQVKTIKGGTWQFAIDEFCEVSFDGDKQILGDRLQHRIPHLLHVMVVATEYKHDRFFVLEWEQLRDIAVGQYSAWLKSKGGIRPKNPKSLHCSVTPEDLREFEKNAWERIKTRFESGSPS